VSGSTLIFAKKLGLRKIPLSPFMGGIALGIVAIV